MRTTRFLGEHRLRRLCLLITCMLTALVAACGSSQSTQQTAAAPSTPSIAVASGSASAAKITISNFQFTSPQSVAPGSTVAVVNSDSAEHSVTADQGGQFNVDADGNGTATFTAPTEPGTYAYHCSYHPMMHGQLIVQ
jgi:plastocyanin